MTVDRLKIVIALFGLLLAVGVLGFMLLENMPLLDAMYMTVVTVATVGYGDIVPHTTAGRIFTMFLVIGGVGMTYYTLTLMFAIIVEGRLKNILGRRDMNRKIASMKNHIVVCGAGRVGGNAIERLLHEEEAFVVIESDQAVYEQLVERKIPAVQGDATRDDILQAAGLDRAKGVITALSHDADNVYVTLTARSLNPQATIIARAERPEAEEKLRRAGATTVIFPSLMGGRQMVSALTKPVIMDFVENVFYNKELHLDIAEITVAPRSSLVGMTLATSGIKTRFDSIVVAIKRGASLITNPAADAVIIGGDIMIVLGHRAALSELVAFAKASE